MKFYTSDTHFGHQNIIKFCNRPFKGVQEMNEAMVDRWNSLVLPTDTVYHLGDVALGPWSEWDGILTRLNGYKILVVGNHDRVFRGEKERMRERFAEHYNKWFDMVVDEVTNIPLGRDMFVNLSHFPYDGDSQEGERYREFRLNDEGRTLLHGHTHSREKVSRSKKGTLQIHVGADAWDYTPVPADVLIELVRKES